MDQQVIDLTIIGLVIVFGVLTIISFAIFMVRKIDDKWQAHEEKNRHLALGKTQNIDDTTLILISAAVATYVGGRFIIHKVRVLPRNVRRTPWSSQGRAVLLGSHTVIRKQD
jgi:Na+-transporting methylmalonyl-CoA/oxaloacetate decarboxylase gamma subunit